MIDCSKTMNYLKEYNRMCESLECDKCPLHYEYGGCIEFETRFPEKTIEIIQKWSDEHPYGI